MAKPQITITLGRSGQKVMKNSWGDSDGVQSGRKRSLAESFANIADHAFSGNKRMRDDESERSYGYSNNVDDSRLGRKDLRLKLTHKRISREIELKNAERNKMELYEKISRAIRSVEPPDDKLLRNVPSSRGAIETPKVGSMRSSYASWTSSGRATISPERIPRSSSGISTPRSAIDELPQVPPIGRINGTRAVLPSDPLDSMLTAPRSSAVISTPRSAIDELPQVPPIGRTNGTRTFLPSNPLDSMLTASSRPLDSGKLITGFPTAAGCMISSAFRPSEVFPKDSQPLTVSSLLQSLGLGKYYIHFQAEEIDMAVLKQMGEGDLKELGIPMGPRKKILLAIQARTKHPATQAPIINLQ